MSEKNMKDVHIFEYCTYKKRMPDITRYRWLFLGFSYNCLVTLRAQVPGDNREILLHDEIEKSVREFRPLFIDYIAALTKDSGAGQNLYSGLVERVPFRSDVFLDICQINAAIKKIRSSDAQDLIVICEHRGLAYDLHHSLSGDPDIQVRLYAEDPVVPFRDRAAASVKILLHAAKISAQLLFRKGITALSRKMAPPGIHKNTGIIVLNSWVAQSSIESGTYRELFFSDLQEKLTEMGYPIVLLPHIPYDVKFSDTLEALETTHKRFITEESCLSVPDIIRVFFRTMRNIPRWSDHRLKTIYFSHSVYLQNFQDWLNLQILVPSLCECIIEGLSRKNVLIRTFIFTFENNAWEKAFMKKLRQCYPETTIIGYQHSTITPNFLYYYVSTSPIDQRYIPDFVITNGEYPSSFLKENNFPRERIVTGGALRYNMGKKTNPVPPGSLFHNNRILITPPGIIDEAAEMLEKVFRALKDDHELELLVKIHPFVPRARIEAGLPDDIIHKIQYTTTPLREILPSAKVLVYSSTTTCIEALSLGIPVLTIKSETRLGLDPLENFHGMTPFISVANHVEDIEDAIFMMKELTMTKKDKEIIDRIVKDIFGEVTDETYRLFTQLKKNR